MTAVKIKLDPILMQQDSLVVQMSALKVKLDSVIDRQDSLVLQIRTLKDKFDALSQDWRDNLVQQMNKVEQLGNLVLSQRQQLNLLAGRRGFHQECLSTESASTKNAVARLEAPVRPSLEMANPNSGNINVDKDWMELSETSYEDARPGRSGKSMVYLEASMAS